MDEGTLNDLLECSVCLERLDTSSKVLPCQHTFCRKCLEEIVQKHKELRCPECRVLIKLKIDELPPNVLLMRILEGMRNAVPKRTQRHNRSSPIHATTLLQPTPVQQETLGTPEHRSGSNKQHSPHHLHHHQPYAKAIYDYKAKELGDLSFKRGDVIILKKRVDTNWYQGECGGKIGVFPLSYVQIVTPVPSHIPQCKALYDFRMTNDEEEGCLAFSKGDVINVIRRVDENWAEGKLDGKIGIFPLAFVELNNLARSLMKLSSNAQPGPSRVAPPTPTTEDSTPLIPTDHTKNVVPLTVTQQAHKPLPTLEKRIPCTSDTSSTVSSGSSTTPNISSSNTSSSSSTAPSSPASPPPRTHVLPPKISIPKPDIQSVPKAQMTQSTHTRLEPPTNHHNKEKRHSFTGLTQPHHSNSNHRHSVELASGELATGELAKHIQQGQERTRRSVGSGGEQTLPVAYIALYPYKPQKADELELKKGGIYMVTERCQDGWFKGTSNRTQKCGVFPGNYVTVARGNPTGSQPGGATTSRETSADSKSVVSFTRAGSKSAATAPRGASLNPPELPPRAVSPSQTGGNAAISSSWHGQQDSASVPLGRSSSAVMSTSANTPTHASTPKSTDKTKERKDKGVSLMRRLTSIKRSKSPPPSTYSMDNPVFEDITVGSSPAHPVHVRSGSCPSQLLQIQPSDHHRMFGSSSQRHKHKERPSIINQNTRSEVPAGSSGSSPDVHRHRKSNSLDAGNRAKTGTHTVRERFRCIAPYPPNSEYELELQVNDVIYVHKKRDDGWYKGTQQRTGRTGLFPASFVENF